jgi:hypothetical protein
MGPRVRGDDDDMLIASNPQKAGTQRTIDDIGGAVRIAVDLAGPCQKALNLFFPPSTPS